LIKLFLKKFALCRFITPLLGVFDKTFSQKVFAQAFFEKACVFDQTFFEKVCDKAFSQKVFAQAFFEKACVFDQTIS